MRKHFITLFNRENRLKTIVWLLISTALVIGSMVIGIADNLPGIVMLLCGMVCLVNSFVHIWKNPWNYALLAGSAFGLILFVIFCIIFLSAIDKTEYINEGVVMGVIFLVSVPAIIMGIIGVIAKSR